MDLIIEEQALNLLTDSIEQIAQTIFSSLKIQDDLTCESLLISAAGGIIVTHTAFLVAKCQPDLPYEKNGYNNLITSIMKKTIENIQKELQEKLPLLIKKGEMN